MILFFFFFFFFFFFTPSPKKKGGFQTMGNLNSKKKNPKKQRSFFSLPGFVYLDFLYYTYNIGQIVLEELQKRPHPFLSSPYLLNLINSPMDSDRASATNGRRSSSSTRSIDRSTDQSSSI
jgi:hypothetical protein